MEKLKKLADSIVEEAEDKLSLYQQIKQVTETHTLGFVHSQEELSRLKEYNTLQPIESMLL